MEVPIVFGAVADQDDAFVLETVIRKLILAINNYVIRGIIYLTKNT